MGLFDSILHKIIPGAAAAPTAGSEAASGSPAPATPSGTSAAGQSAASSAAPAQPVDVFAVLTQMATQKAGGGNWQSSIVDLLKLLDLDSSLSARKQLAQELDVHAGADGSAEENIALHKAVIDQLEANGGKIPDTLRH